MMSQTLSRADRIKALDEAFISLMWIAKQQISHRLQRFGLTHPQFMVLATLAAHGQPCTMSDLTGITFQDPPTMTGIIDRLVKMKLVQRTRSEIDRRVVLAEATTAGKELVQSIEEDRLHDATTGYAALTDEDLTVLEELLRYVLRMHVGRYKSLCDDELDAEIEKLRIFKNDPISYAKLHTK
ncbi:MAG: MarR family transcriptional regulator [Anaerolineae bacterium]|nr:MarR family transcriptional regulator [Anaerolineae bacterium]